MRRFPVHKTANLSPPADKRKSAGVIYANGLYNVKTEQMFGMNLQDLETISIGIVFGVDRNGVVAIDLRPAFDTRDNGRLSRHRHRLLYPAGESRSDDAFMNKHIPFLQFAFGKPLRHPGRGAGTARAPVDGLVAVKHGVAGRGSRIDRLTRPENMRTAMDGGVLRMDELVCFIDPLPHDPAPADQLVRRILFQSLEILLGIDDGIEVPAIRNINL